MKTTEDLALDYVNFSSITFPEEAVKKAFKKGVEIAQRWLDIHKEEPEYYQPILADNGEYIAVVARVSDGDEDFYPICGTHVYMNPDPIKWRPIELK
jgi:hypothetical protein